MKTEIVDTIIVGAGAAGLKAAITCARGGLKTLLLDSQDSVGAKILMSGGTRCNVTNETVTEKDFSSNHPRAVRNILRAWPSEKARQFFDELNVKLIREDSGKYFPASNSARTVLNALLDETNRLGVMLRTGKKVTEIVFESNHFRVVTASDTFRGKTVILTTGGLSYPTTGSDGSGYQLARHFAHTIVKTRPALTPLMAKEKVLKTLSGIAVPCRLSLKLQGKTSMTFESPLLFTHFGFSGPAALNMSRFWLVANEIEKAQLFANFVPDVSEEKFLNTLKEEQNASPNQTLRTVLKNLFPERMIDVWLNFCDISKTGRLSHLSRAKQRALIESLYRFELPVSGVFGYQKAEVTAGGVSLEEVSTTTLESNRQAGLFFAGEILDADGRIGGFNFQWAWASAHVAAEGAVKRLKGAAENETIKPFGTHT